MLTSTVLVLTTRASELTVCSSDTVILASSFFNPFRFSALLFITVLVFGFLSTFFSVEVLDLETSFSLFSVFGVSDFSDGFSSAFSSALP